MEGLVPKVNAKRPTTHYNEDDVDPVLFEEIGRVVAAAPGKTIDYNRLSELLNQPVRTIQANLRNQRARLALALLPLAQQHLMEFTGRYYVLHDQVATELERRISNPEILQGLSHIELIQTIGVIHKRMELVDKFVGVAPLPEKVIELIQPKTTAASVLELIEAMHQVRGVRNREVEEAQVVEDENTEAGT